MDEHRLVVEACLDFFFVQILSDVFVFAEVFIEVFTLQPAFHSVSLYPAVSGVSVSAFGNEGQEYSRAVNEAAGEVQVSHHLFRINEELVDQAGRLVQDVVKSDGSIRNDDTFYGRVGNISFMPERNVFECRYAVALDDSCHAADSFRFDRVSLMWHCGGAFLFRAEVFFCFSDFGSLQVADFQSDLGKNACNDAECGDVFSMVIALNDLGSYDFRSEAEFLAYVGFYEWIDIRIGANGAGEFADCHFFSSTFHSFDVAEGFGVPEQNFQAEGGRFSMDTVCSADGWCVLEFHSSSLQNFCEFFQIGNEDLGCLFDLDIESGILDIGGGQAHVDVLGFIAYVFADEYATRILNMSDGVIVGDTNEYTLDECLSDEAADLAAKTAAEEKALSDIEQSGAKNAKRALKRIEKKKRKKASMSPLTAFSLSFTNLISKKGRTFLTSFAGSIGIIGIMLVLALSTGARSFISKMEENALSQYPIEISESNTDLSAILSLLTTDTAKREKYPSGDTIYTQQVIGNVLDNIPLLTSKNDLARLKSYIDNNFDETIGYVKYNYGTDFDVYCDYTHAKGDEDKYMKVQPFVDAIADIPVLSGFKEQLEMFSSYLTVWDEMTDNTTLLNRQYELLGNSKWPTNYDEVVLVVDRKNQINDYTLFALGLKSKEDIGSALGGSTGGENSFSNSTFSISDIIGENGKEPLQYQIATGCDYYHKNTETGKWEKISARDDQRAKTFIDGETDGRKNTVNVKVVGDRKSVV